MIQYPEFGYYEYDGNSYFDKFDVLDLALSKKDYNPNITFNFNDHVYSKIDWEKEPEFSLNELYKIRAQQLRDSYDYLILMYTGGSDSHQILHSFLDNDIFLDEVQSIHPLKITSSLKAVEDTNHQNAFLFEYDLTTVPGLKELNKKSPKTKIEILDMSDDLMNYCGDENYFGDRRHPSQFGVYHMIKTNVGLEYNRKNSERKGKVAVIYGVDKPKLVIRNNKLFSYFVDVGRPGAQPQRKENDVNYKTVFFYLTPDLPLITVKQSHVIKKFIEKIPSVYDAFISKKDIIKTSVLMRQIIYPSWNTNIFQSNKIGNAFSWHEEQKFLESLNTGMGNFINSRKQSLINKYSKFDINFDSIWMMTVFSKYYYIGDIKREQI